MLGHERLPACGAGLAVAIWKAADIVGRRRVFITGLTVFAVATFLCAVAPSGGVLIALRLLQGVGGALIFGTGTAILTSVYPPARLGRALGVAVACVYLGLSLGPFVGGMLTAWLGWRGIFLFTAPLAAGAAVLVAVRLQGEWAEAEGERFDLVGAILYGGALGYARVGMLSGAILDQRQEKGGVRAGFTRMRQTRLHRHDLSGTKLE